MHARAVGLLTLVRCRPNGSPRPAPRLSVRSIRHEPMGINIIFSARNGFIVFGKSLRREVILPFNITLFTL